MNVRTLLLIAGLALPVVAFAILSQSMPDSSKTVSVPNDMGDDGVTPPADSKNEAAATQADTPQDTPTTEEQAADVAPDAGQVPEGVKPGPMSVPPVVLPPIAEQQQQPPRNPNAMTLKQAIDKVQSRLTYLERLHPGEWPEERKRHRNAPATLAEAKEFNRTRLAKLTAMTEKQWNQEQQAAEMRLRQRWQSMNPQEQMQAYQENQRQKQAEPQ
jgi:hypothetical protein